MKNVVITPKEWNADALIMNMSLTEQGIYLRLLIAEAQFGDELYDLSDSKLAQRIGAGYITFSRFMLKYGDMLPHKTAAVKVG